MSHQIIEIDLADWRLARSESAWISALEGGKLLYFPQLRFELDAAEKLLLRPDRRAPQSRNISLDANGVLKGAVGDAATLAGLAAMIGRFQAQSADLVAALLPRYPATLRLAPTSFRPTQVASRTQSWRADDRRLHVDAFPSRPNRGERILRVFSNINPDGVARLWRVGETFEDTARRFLPRARPYSALAARTLKALRITKSLRSEYDHLMLQLHDGMKADLNYQREAAQQEVAFRAGSTWVCFPDQTSHAAMSGQYLLEQTLHLPVSGQYDPTASPLAILNRLTGRILA